MISITGPTLTLDRMPKATDRDGDKMAIYILAFKDHDL